MKVIVGLGNPGEKFAGNRHNVGFWVIDALASELGVHMKYSSSLNAEVGFKDVKLGQNHSTMAMLCKPYTFMNNSGDTVRDIMALDKDLMPRDVLVVYDDMDFAVGKAKMRGKGSAGHHNGMRSIVGWIGEDFPRIRVGIGRPTEQDILEYVLSDFEPDEACLIKEGLIPHILKAIMRFPSTRVDNIMSEFNKVSTVTPEDLTNPLIQK